VWTSWIIPVLDISMYFMWYSFANRLKLNADKTVYLARHASATIEGRSDATSVERSAVTAENKLSVRDLGMLTDSQLTMEAPHLERRLQLLLSTPAVTQHPAITTNRRLANPGCCIHRQSRWLLQRRSVLCLFTSHPSTSDGPERCCPFGHRCSQIRTHHAGSSRRALLAPSATVNTVQNSSLFVWLCSWALSCLLQQCLHPSRRHFWSGKSSFGRTSRHACPFDKNTVRLTEFLCCSPSRLKCASITVPLIIISRGQFRAGLKLISSHRPVDDSANFCWKAYYFTFTIVKTP